MSYIGVFDSGIGGLSILKVLMDKYTNESFEYLADTKHLPYGEKPKDQLTEIFLKNMNYFKDVKGIIVACNTMSDFILADMDMGVPIIGIADCLVNSIEQQSSNIGVLGILGTQYTIDSGIYSNKLKKMGLRVEQVAARTLAEALENRSDDVWDVFQSYINQFSSELTHLVLACTHYNILYDRIKVEYSHLEIIDPYDMIIKEVSQSILKNKSTNIKPNRFLTTQYNKGLQINSKDIMGKDIYWEEISL